jgi:tRNA1(Val) A37 N6-methylase TrmN6
MPQTPALPPATAPEGALRGEELPTTDDAFLGGLLRIRQLKDGSRAGMDAVLLAAACPAQAGESVLEAGAGSGIVALAVARRVPDCRVTGVEIDPRLVALACANADANGLADRARFIAGDVTAPSSAFAPTGLIPSSFDHVLANPPFLAEGEARLPPSAMLRRAHAAAPGEWEGWARFLAAFARPRGTLTLIHRADALPRLLPLIEKRFGDLLLYPLFPREGEAATRVIIRGRKGRRGRLELRRGLVLHRLEGGFSEAAEAILRGGAPLELEGP